MTGQEADSCGQLLTDFQRLRVAFDGERVTCRAALELARHFSADLRRAQGMIAALQADNASLRDQLDGRS